MPEEFAKIKEYADYLRSLYSERNTMQDEMEDIYTMTWSEETAVKARMDNVKLTKSPDARNSLIGAVRLLVAADPVVSVPRDANPDVVEQAADQMERAASQMWRAAGRVRGNPVHYDVVLSTLLFGEAYIPITRSADMVRHALGSSPAARKRIEAIAERTPFLFDAWDPRTCYPDLDSTGLRALYREVTTTTGAVMDAFGAPARKQLSEGGRYTEVTLCHFWDYENRFVWLKESGTPILEEAHGLPFVPVIAQIGEGSLLFADAENQRQPFLYTLWKSGLHDRQSLSLTVLYTMIFAIGANPMFVYQANQPGKRLDVDYSVPGKSVIVEKDESYGPLLKAVIDPSLMRGMEIADQKSMESTIYAQSLGEPLGNNAPFSMVALLHQAGRLPLIMPQRKASWAIADALSCALRWAKAEGWGDAGYAGVFDELTASEIPERFELEVKLDISLPQDQMQQAQVAAMLAGGEMPLASNRYVREKLLNIAQSDDMTREIWTERAAWLRYTAYLQEEMMRAQQQAQQAMQPPPPSGEIQPPPGDGRQPLPEQEPPMMMAPNQAAMMRPTPGGQPPPPMMPAPQVPPVGV